VRLRPPVWRRLTKGVYRLLDQMEGRIKPSRCPSAPPAMRLRWRRIAFVQPESSELGPSRHTAGHNIAGYHYDPTE